MPDNNHITKKATSNEVNKNRRNLLKFLFIGGGTLLLGKVFGSSFFNFFSGPKAEQDFKNFRVTEDRKELIISDKTGEKLLIIDKGN